MSFWRRFLENQVPRRHLLVFYVGIPGMVAILFGLNHAGMGRFLAIEIGVIYWLGIFVPAWLVLDICSRLAAAVLRPWSPPLWLILLIGSVTAVVILQPYAVWHGSLYAGQLPTGVQYAIAAPLPSLLGEWAQLAGYVGTPMFWIAINYYYDRLLDIPRYRGSLLEIMEPPRSRHTQVLGGNAESADHTKSDAPAASNAGSSEGFQRQTPLEIGREIIALRAEDHYIRVYTTQGNALIRYRFGDALKDVASLDGLQVHRSCWVKRSAVKKLISDDEGTALVLTGDIQIPVSRAYQKVVQQAGWG
jgi:LytTr DNA-binding domain